MKLTDVNYKPGSRDKRAINFNADLFHLSAFFQHQSFVTFYRMFGTYWQLEHANKKECKLSSRCKSNI